MKIIDVRSNRYVLILILSFSLSSFNKTDTDRNLLYVYLNSNNELLVDRNKTELDSLKDIVKLFISNPKDESIYAERQKIFIKELGYVMVSKGLISIQCERNTTYEFYIQAHSELEKAFNEMRNELSIEKFKIQYNKLNIKREKAIKEAIPTAISEAEPLYIRTKNGELIRNPIYIW